MFGGQWCGPRNFTTAGSFKTQKTRVITTTEPIGQTVSDSGHMVNVHSDELAFLQEKKGTLTHATGQRETFQRSGI